MYPTSTDRHHKGEAHRGTHGGLQVDKEAVTEAGVYILLLSPPLFFNIFGNSLSRGSFFLFVIGDGFQDFGRIYTPVLKFVNDYI